MPKFVIERQVPGASKLTEDELRAASLASLKALGELGPEIQWIHSFVTDDMKATEIVTLLRDDVRVTVNSDDPAYFKGYMTENFAALAETAELSPAELVQLSRNAFEIAWLTPRARDGYLAELDAYAAANGVA